MALNPFYNRHRQPTHILNASCPTCFPHAAGMQLEIMLDLGFFGMHKDVAKCCGSHKINVCACKTATTPAVLMWYLMTYMCFSVPWRYHRLTDALAWLVCVLICVLNACLCVCVRVGIMALSCHAIHMFHKIRYCSPTGCFDSTDVRCLQCIDSLWFCCPWPFW